MGFTPISALMHQGPPFWFCQVAVTGEDVLGRDIAVSISVWLLRQQADLQTRFEQRQS